MFRPGLLRSWPAFACLLAVLPVAASAAWGRKIRRPAPASGPAMPSARRPLNPAPPAAAPAAASWLISSGGGMPWQVGAMFTGFWVLSAAEIAIISKIANRLDKPKKKDSASSGGLAGASGANKLELRTA